MFQETAKTRAVEFFRAKSSGQDAITYLAPEDHATSIAAADAFIQFTGASIIFGSNEHVPVLSKFKQKPPDAGANDERRERG